MCSPIHSLCFSFSNSPFSFDNAWICLLTFRLHHHQSGQHGCRLVMWLGRVALPVSSYILSDMTNAHRNTAYDEEVSPVIVLWEQVMFSMHFICSLNALSIWLIYISCWGFQRVFEKAHVFSHEYPVTTSCWPYQLSFPSPAFFIVAFVLSSEPANRTPSVPPCTTTAPTAVVQ